jgi:glucokinase
VYRAAQRSGALSARLRRASRARGFTCGPKLGSGSTSIAPLRPVRELMLIAADVGGTKTIVALFALPDLPGQLPRRIEQATFASRAHPNLEAIVERFLEQLGPRRPATLQAACFGVAGPVIGVTSRTPNLPWLIDGAELARKFQIGAVALLNDLVATAIRAATLGPGDVVTLSPGRSSPPATPRQRVVVAAGTGLGVAQLVEQAGRWLALPSEGGHACFAPRNAEECALLDFLAQRHGRVSLERVVSGRGLAAIYEFLLARGELAADPAVCDAILADLESAPRLVSERAAAGGCAVARRALELFVELYGAAAGNFALAVLATDGVFLGGGIAPKILPALQSGRFLSAFLDKGRLRPLMETIPVYVIEDPETALLGAAIEAGRIALSRQELSA